jgi:hypothetical protein
METKFTHTMPPTENMQDEVQVSEVSRLGNGVNELMGPVVVGGCYSSDCFRYGPGTLQAGREPKAASEIYEMYDPSEPRKEPW